ALMTAQADVAPDEMLADPDLRGRLVESAIGACLANAAAMGECELSYWRDGDQEVDFVLRAGRSVTAIEVKSGKVAAQLRGLTAFEEAFRPTRSLLVGANGIPLDEFLERPVGEWVRGQA
ncbi:MAG: AAA family ATPase, partial [Planctomycetota bacterium]